MASVSTSGETSAADRNGRGGRRFVRGNDARRVGLARKAARLAAKAEELAAEYGGLVALSAADAGRIRLAAKHLIVAEDVNDPATCVRSTRTAEMLLARIRRPEEVLPSLQEYLARG
jgi:hypothetical protein